MRIRFLAAAITMAAGLMLAPVGGTVTPAAAQGIHVQVPGVHVGVGHRSERRVIRQEHWDRGHHRGWEQGRHRGWEPRRHRSNNCRTVTIRRDDGRVRQIRRCD